MGVDRVELGESIGEDVALGLHADQGRRFTFFDFVPKSDDRHGRTRSPCCWLRAGRSIRRKVAEGRSFPSIRRTRSEFTLVWADGSVSLVEAIGRGRVRRSGKPQRTLCARDAGESRRPRRTARRFGRSPRAGEGGSVTCARLLDDNRIVVEQQTVVESACSATGRRRRSRLVIDDVLPAV